LDHNRTILRLAGVAAMMTAATTFLLWLLPKLYVSPTNFTERTALATNTFYLARQWVNLLHIPLALTAYFGLAYKLGKREFPKVALGMMWFLIWGIVEMTGIAGIIFVVNNNWRIRYSSAPDSLKAVLQGNIENYYAIWDAMFFVLLICFLLGTIFFGWATWKGQGLEKVLSYLFWLAAPLTVLIILSGYFNFTWGEAIIAIVYPILQPISRFLLGWYLIRKE
jgi:hypothetical protein